MSKQPFALIFRGTIHFVAPPSVWWKDGTAFGAIREALQRAGLWLDLPFKGRSARKLSPATDAVAWSTTWKVDEDYVLSRAKDGSLRDTTLVLTPRPQGLQLYFLLRGADAEAQRQTFLGAVAALARDVRGRDLFGGVRLWKWDVELERDYPTPRPLLYPQLWPVGMLLVIIDRDYFVQFSHFKEQGAEELARVLAAPLPPGAVREEDGPLTVFRFVGDLTDDAAIDRARGEQHRWIAGLVRSEEGAVTNEQGDQRVFVLSPESHPPLTVYDPVQKHGYKAVFLTDDGGGDADLDEAARWLSAKQLPDGTPVHGISIVAPGRDAAVAAVDRVRARGLTRLLYVDNSGDFWDPFVEPRLDDAS